jgi:fructosamine-3-kinase
MNAALQRAVATAIHDATGKPFENFKATTAASGCINQTYRLEKDGRCFFLKLNADAPSAMFEAEQRALQAMAETQTIRVPQPIARGESGGIRFLVLEHLELSRGGASWAKLGEELANLHRHASPNSRHGWTESNFIGSTPQPNSWHDDWISFWREERLGHQLRLAADDGHRFNNTERLLTGLDSLLAHRPVPSLLHGDLWGGNIGFTNDGVPVIYDPASYYGDRETDLAMTRLFGALPSAFYDAYHAVYPLPSGHEIRRDLYNLYHVLNHAHLFGGHYAAQAQTMIDQLVIQIG